MARLVLAVVALLAASLPAIAQSNCSYIKQGAVLTPAQWNQCFAAKNDILPYTPVNKSGDTMLGRLVMTASTTSRAGLSLPQGVAPTTPVDGDMWTTTTGLFVRINGSTVGPVLPGALASGRIFVGNGSNVAVAVAVSGDATMANTGALTVTKTSGVNFGAFATGTDAANLTGTIASGVQDNITRLGTIASGVWNGTAVPVANGGTGAATAANARTNLGLGSIATQAASAVAITGGAITGMPTPTLSSDVATKSYADSIASGISPRTPVKWATAAVLPNSPTYSNGAAGVGATLTAGSNAAIAVDGGSPASSDRVLVKNQAAPAQNGVYSVTTVGSGGAPWVLTRVTDFDQASEMISGASFLVSAGSTNIGTGWVLATTVTTVGTDAATFNQYQSISGALLSANNLSDVGTLATAVANLGLTIGTNVQAFDSDLSALAANSTNGLWARTGTGAGTARTITGTASQITVTNGDGVSGAPTISLPSALSLTGITVSNELVANNNYLQWKDSGGTARNVLALDSSNNLQLIGNQGVSIYSNQAASQAAFLINPDSSSLMRTLYGVNDIRLWGTVTCDGASHQNVVDAISAAIGNDRTIFKRIFLPKNCLWDMNLTAANVPSINTVPANIEVIGEDWNTSGLKVKNQTAAPPSTDGQLNVNGKSILRNVYVIDNACYHYGGGATDTSKVCPIQLYINSGDGANGMSNYPYQGMVMNCSPVTTPNGQAISDLPCAAFLQSTVGDGIFLATIQRGDALHVQTNWDGTNPLGPQTGDRGVNIINGFSDSGGHVHLGIHIDEYGTNTDDENGSVVVRRLKNGANALTVLDSSAAGISSFTSHAINIVTNFQTSGALINLYQGTSTYTDSALVMSMANGGGTFTGRYLDFIYNTVRKFSVKSNGGFTSGGDTISFGLNSISFAQATNWGLAINNTDAANNAAFAVFLTNGTQIGSIINNSNTSTQYLTTSDRRRKEDEKPYALARSVIDGLHVWDFRWKGTDKRSVGVFAQDAYGIFPDAISPPTKQSDLWQADYSKFVPVLISDAQETHRRLLKIERRLAIESTRH